MKLTPADPNCAYCAEGAPLDTFWLEPVAPRNGMILRVR